MAMLDSHCQHDCDTVRSFALRSALSIYEGPRIVMYSYNNANQMHLFLKLASSRSQYLFDICLLLTVQS
jgi:hypothetical protein